MANRKNDEKNYTKPGDDKIVSGKGFLISMPSLKKTNPVKALLGGGDKKKDEAQKNVQKAQITPEKGNKKNGADKNALSNKYGNTRFGGNQGHGAKPGDRKAATDVTSVQGAKTEASNASHDDKNPRHKTDIHDRRNDRNARKNAHRQENQSQRGNNNTSAQSHSVAENHEKNVGGKNRDKFRRENRRNKGMKNENLRLQAVEAAIAATPTSATAQKKENRNGDTTVKAFETGKNDRNRRKQKGRPQNQKPSAAEYPEINNENNNVGRIVSTIVSASPIRNARVVGKKESAVFGGLGGIFADERVNGNANTNKEPEEEPVYVDKNRPLAEQIMEDMAKRRGAAKPVSVTDTEEKTEIVGVRFRNSGKIYYFAPGNVKVEAGENVIVETARGIEYGFVAIGNTFVKNSRIVSPLKNVVRKATAQDTETYNLHRIFEKMSEHFFRYHVEKLGLEMALVYVEYTFDASKVIFYFTADGRVDFRELIKELAAGYKTRIELRQIGVRDEAKLIGGLGICGRPICCNSFLSEFSQVSIKMAKEQNLFLNSSKISGTCGRFMCCLKFEDESYRKEYEMTPKAGDEVITPDGRGKVMESNAMKGIVSVLLDDRKEELPIEFSREQVQFVNPPKSIPAPEKAEPSDRKPQNVQNIQIVKKPAEDKEFSEKSDADNAKKSKEYNAHATLKQDESVVKNRDTAVKKAQESAKKDEQIKVDTTKVENAPTQTENQQNTVVNEATKAKEAKGSVLGMAVSEKNVIVVDESVESSMKFGGNIRTYDEKETVAVQTTPDKTDGVAFADGIVTYDDTEAEIQKSIFEKNVDKVQNADTSDFVMSTESASKSEAFADGVITVEE